MLALVDGDENRLHVDHFRHGESSIWKRTARTEQLLVTKCNCCRAFRYNNVATQGDVKSSEMMMTEAKRFQHEQTFFRWLDF